MVLEHVTDYAMLSGGDVVLEVGAGFGFLTRHLAARCKQVMAIERDQTIATVLAEQLRDLRNVELITGNVLKTDVPAFNKVVSIPPYQISSKLLQWLLRRRFDCTVLVFQKEFVRHLVASVGSDEYGWLTVMAYRSVDVELLEQVSKRAFYPHPQVDSTVIRLKPRIPKPFEVKNEEQFARFLQSLFTSRNRKIRNAVVPFLKGVMGLNSTEAHRLADTAPFHDRRPRELSPENIGELTNALTS